MNNNSPQQVPLRIKLFYGVGAVAEGTKNVAFNTFLLFYYNQVLGVSGTLSGTAIFIALCVDAITDPLVGALSDNFHSRWGRRHVFMYSSALPMALCFFLLFNPPSGLGQTGLFLWLTMWAVGVRTAMTFYLVPSGAMLPEITSGYDERTSLVSCRFLCGWMGGLITAQMGYLYFFAPSSQFADGRLNPDAYGMFAFAGAVIIGLAILTSSAGTHHLIATMRTPSQQAPFSLQNLLGEMREALGNYSYLMLVWASLFLAVAAGFQDAMGLYMGTYFWELTTRQLSLLVYAYMIATLIASVLARPLTQRFDKKKTVVGLALFAILVGPLPVFFRLLGLMPANGTPLLLSILFANVLIIVSVVITAQITVASMLADIIDEHDLNTGKRQEGLFLSALSFIGKATSGLGGFFAGVALDLINFPKGAAARTVPPETLFNLGLVIGPGMIVLHLLCLFFVSRYRITREYHQHILTQLAQRSQSAAAS
jgi:Na+/melibiose symporter-like transporter